MEYELQEVQPLIDQARQSVGQIKSDNINEIRSLKMPPEAIRDVLEGVLLLMGQKDTSWKNMKKFLGSKSVKDQVINFDARTISRDIRQKVQPKKDAVLRKSVLKVFADCFTCTGQDYDGILFKFDVCVCFSK